MTGIAPQRYRLDGTAASGPDSAAGTTSRWRRPAPDYGADQDCDEGEGDNERDQLDKRVQGVSIAEEPSMSEEVQHLDGCERER